MPEISATIRVVDAFSNPLDKLANGLSRAQSGFSRLKGALGGNMFGSAEKSSSGLFKSMAGGVAVGNMISKGMGLAGSGIRSMLGELNEASTSWQTFEGNMHQLGASNTEINKAKTEMQQFAQQTIYSASDMSSTYAQLAAVGTKNTAQLVKGFGGLASAADNPQQAMKTLSEQATQMAAKPKVQWQDFKLMLEQTPAGISAVAKTMGESTTSLIKDIQDGKVKTQDFLNAVAKTGTNANFSKMATQYKTVGQAMDGLKETLANNLQPAFDKVSKVGIKWVSNLSDRIGKLNFTKIGDQLSDSLSKINIDQVFGGIGDAASRIMPVISEIGTSIGQMFDGFQNSGAINGIISMFQTATTAIKNMFSSINFSGLFEGIGQAIGNLVNMIAPVFNSLISLTSNLMSTLMPILSSVGSAIMTVIQPIASTVTQVLSSAFDGLSAGLAPLANAFNQLRSAAAPLAPILQIVGHALGTLGGAALAGVALGIGVVVDALTSLVSIAAGVVNAVRGIAQGFHALGDALTGNFSGAKRDIEDAKNAMIDMKNSFGNVGNAIGNGVTANMIKQFSQVGSAAKKTASDVNGIKMKPQVDVASANAKIADLGKKTVQGPKVKVEKPKLNFTNPFKNILGGNTKTIPAPKIGKPKVPTPSVPKTVKSIKAPKVDKPKVPTPTMPKELKTVKAPKVAKPKVPQPSMPKLKTIPAPKVRRPNMSGVVSAVRSGMSRAASAARAGGAQISAAVRSALNQAVAAARSAAGAMQAAGVMIGQGLANGIRSQVGAVAAAANELVAQANRAARAAAQIHSPSRLFAEVGSFIGQGMAVGMDSTRGLISQSSRAMINSAYPGLNSSISSSSSLSSSSIRPNSATSSNYYTGGTNNSSEITIAPGAIVINSSGNPEADADALLDRLEEKIMEQADKSLS
ncbi:tape measure protein [Lactobacillus helveticus]|uniref:tape measure protein n=1 Tax=Lactobacillus helveticus TaxID=1587 RepID=UPI00207D02A3|nr:tape measure protein [Lactobacillus helveticus]MCO0806696.1 tape measure protein [Lactobacillus helveticus]